MLKGRGGGRPPPPPPPPRLQPYAARPCPCLDALIRPQSSQLTPAGPPANTLRIHVLLLRFKPGDRVVRRIPSLRNKLLYHYSGPYRVAEVLDGDRYRLRNQQENRLLSDRRSYYQSTTLLYVRSRTVTHYKIMNIWWTLSWTARAGASRVSVSEYEYGFSFSVFEGKCVVVGGSIFARAQECYKFGRQAWAIFATSIAMALFIIHMQQRGAH